MMMISKEIKITHLTITSSILHMSNIPEDLYPVKYDPLTPITMMMAMAKKVVQSRSPSANM